jgi:hypothetical protein
LRGWVEVGITLELKLVGGWNVERPLGFCPSTWNMYSTLRSFTGSIRLAKHEQTFYILLALPPSTLLHYTFNLLPQTTTTLKVRQKHAYISGDSTGIRKDGYYKRPVLEKPSVMEDEYYKDE